METIKWRYIDVWSKKIRAINLLGGECKKCGNSNIFHLTFHHKNNNDKEFGINEIKTLRWSKIKSEVEKCELLCENCHTEYHYEKNKNEKRNKKIKLVFLDYTQSNCERCGYNKSESSLMFHHIDDKKFKISRIQSGIKNIVDLDNYIIEELNKCEVLCGNCHFEEHVDKTIFNKYKDEIYFKVENYKEIQTKIPREKVYKMYNSGIKQKDIATHFSASKSTISGIIKKYKQMD